MILLFLILPWEQNNRGLFINVSVWAIILYICSCFIVNMRKLVVIGVFLYFVFLSVMVDAKRIEGGPVVVRPSVVPFSATPIESSVSGFVLRKTLFNEFPVVEDKRVRKSDVSRVSLIRSLLGQTVSEKLYRAPNFNVLNCGGSVLFNKDRSMVQPLVELACLRNIQIPVFRNAPIGRGFSNGGVSGVSRITGKVVSGIFSVPKSDCNAALKDIASSALETILRSERDLVNSAIAVSNCGDSNVARYNLARGDSHYSSMRYASAINEYENAWRRAVSCECSTLG